MFSAYPMFYKKLLQILKQNQYILHVDQGVQNATELITLLLYNATKYSFITRNSVMVVTAINLHRA